MRIHTHAFYAIVANTAAVMLLLVEALARLLELQHIVALHYTAPFAAPRLTATEYIERCNSSGLPTLPCTESMGPD
jgi:hypothetical protein